MPQPRLSSREARSQGSSLLKWLLPLLFIAITAATVFYLKSIKPEAKARPIKEKIWAVSVTEAKPAAYQPEMVLYGKVETPRMSTLSAAVAAYVKDTPTDEGRSFDANAPLLSLDDRDIRLLLAQRKADLQSSEAQLAAEKVRYAADLKALAIEKDLLRLSEQGVARIANLKKRNVASQEQLDDARRAAQQQALSLNSRQQSINDHPNRRKQMEAAVTRAKALYDTAALDLERTQIRVPFTGRVAKLHVAPGDRVRVGDALMTVYGLDRLEVRVQVPSRILPLIRQALTDHDSISARATLDGAPLQLSLDRLAGEVQDGRAGVDALFSIRNGDNLPEPGRLVSISLSLPEQSNVLALPATALYGTNRIYRMVDGRLDKVRVERVGDLTLPDGKARILVRSPELQAGDAIVTTQLPNAVEGLSVREAGKPAQQAAGGNGGGKP